VELTPGDTDPGAEVSMNALGDLLAVPISREHQRSWRGSLSPNDAAWRAGSGLPHIRARMCHSLSTLRAARRDLKKTQQKTAKSS